jgi:asparagine synthase (glutamine-hydrolysing)
VCGIAGVAERGVATPGAALPAPLRHSLRHRGPDDVGFLAWDEARGPRSGREPEALGAGRVWLAHRRLSILDLSDAGWQPMSTPDGRHHLVFNGEIYNFVELRRELEAAGRAFRSRSDSEVLLAALAHWGEAALPRLVGMFAFAWLDTARSRLLLARDFFGIKPLYWTPLPRTGGADAPRVAFASELPPLLALRGRAAAHPRRLYDYLRFGITDQGGETSFADVFQLPPAHLLEIDLGAPQAPLAPRAFWRLEPRERCDLSFEEAARTLRDLFLESIALHLRSDVPVGAALSGGIDSSAIVMAMRALQGDALDLHTFSYVAAGSAVSEEKWAALVASEAKATAHTVRATPEDLARDVDRLIEVQGEPFGSTSIYAQHRVFGLAAEAGIRVMLDGQGADELLAGYQSYFGARFASLVRAGRLGEALRFLRAASARPGANARGIVQRAAGLLLPAPLAAAARRLVGQELLPAWLDADWFARRGVEPRAPWRPSGASVLRGQLLDAIRENSLPMLLRYEDRNSMAFSIESRVPFLTPRLAEFVTSLPEPHLLAADGTSKAVFRRAMRGLVPDAVLDRRDKIGFATPEESWLVALRPWIQEVLASEAASRVAPLRIDALRRAADALLSGRVAFDFRLWRWLNVIRWAERFDVSFEG